MTVAEIMEQAKTLSTQERKELVKLLIDILDVPLEQKSNEPAGHWGKSLNQLFDQFEPIQMLYPEIEDPVEWVNHLRAEQHNRRLSDWGEEYREGQNQ
jgi:hypothetical protein